MMHGLLLMFVAGCKAPPDAPEELDELVGYLYAHVADEDDAPLEVGAANLDAWLGERLEETLDGYTVENLSEETVSSLGEGERKLTDLAGAAVGHVSEATVEDLVSAALLEDAAEVYGPTYISFEREFEGDVACFVAGDCDWLESEVWSSQDFTLIQVETNSRIQYRWVDTPNGRAFVERTWLRVPATVSLDGLEVDQQYYVWMMLPEGDGSRSIQSTWIVAKMSGDQLDEDFALRMVINSMSKLATDLDTYVLQ